MKYTLRDELKDYSREDLIEEIARLRICLVKRNSKVYQKVKKIFLDEKKEFIKDLKEGCWICGSKKIHMDGRKNYKTNLCDNCHNAINGKNWGVILKRYINKIDKLARGKLIEGDLE